MMRVPPGGTADFDADLDEDTLEMMLTPADMRLLAQAEEQQRAASVAEPAPHPPTTDSILPSMPSQTTSTQNSASLAGGALAGVAAALVIVIAIAALSSARLTTDAKPNTPPQTSKLVAAAATATAETESPSPQLAQTQPLRFKNPFDKSEVFEFPPGTTLEEARASVADLLMQRAQGRHIRPGLQHSRINGAAPHRSAKQAQIAQTAKRG
jgi:hypothetical protein